MKSEIQSVYLAPKGLSELLLNEIETVIAVHDRLIFSSKPFIDAHWAQNIWKSTQIISIESINDAAKKLIALQKNWCLYSFTLHRRAKLIQEKLNLKPQKPLLFFWMGLFGGFSGRGGRNSGGNGLIVAYMLTIVVWLLSQILLAALSRYREYAADRGASLITGRPGDLASALTRISNTMANVPKDDLRKAEGMNAFFIFPAIGDSIVNLFSTHPKMTSRIERLVRLENTLRS